MDRVECPVCGRLFPKSHINAHADRCLDETDVDDKESSTDISLSLDRKRPRLDAATEMPSPHCNSPPLFDSIPALVDNEATSVSIGPDSDLDLNSSSTKEHHKAILLGQNVQSTHAFTTTHHSAKQNTKSSGLLDFLTSQKSSHLKNSNSARGSVKCFANALPTLKTDVQMLKSPKESLQTESAGKAIDTLTSGASNNKASDTNVSAVFHSSLPKASLHSVTTSTSIPLAERMRPTVLADFVGQGHVVGSQRPLRSLLESTNVSSMILWGPPGCGKV